MSDVFNKAAPPSWGTFPTCLFHTVFSPLNSWGTFPTCLFHTVFSPLNSWGTFPTCLFRRGFQHVENVLHENVLHGFCRNRPE